MTPTAFSPNLQDDARAQARWGAHLQAFAQHGQRFGDIDNGCALARFSPGQGEALEVGGELWVLLTLLLHFCPP